MDRRLRFHWSLSQAGDKFRRLRPTGDMPGLLDLEAQAALCRQAERSGIESVLMAIGFTRPDPLLLSAALGAETSRVGFMVACRPGLISPTLFVQQINTLSTLIGGRVSINIVAGHTPSELRYYGDSLPHDERYARTDEFLTICRRFWERGEDEDVDFAGEYFRIDKGRLNTPFLSPERSTPEIFVGGNSRQAADLAIRHADCLWRFPDAPQRLAAEIGPVLAAGKEVGLLVALIARPSRDEAAEAARAMRDGFGDEVRDAKRRFLQNTDSKAFADGFRLADETPTEWVTSYLWTGAVPYLGAPSIALVGGPHEIASAILEYRAIGITQFLFMGWPDDEEMRFFGQEILPAIRERELAREPERSDAQPHIE
jgi:alkanesulfonate monooxygenase